MRVVIVGGGMAGLVLARGLMVRGIAPVVLERAPSHAQVPGPIMLPFQGYDPLTEIGVFDGLRAKGFDIPPYQGGLPVSVGVARQTVLGTLREGVDVRYDAEVTGLRRDGDRVTGCELLVAGERQAIDADLVVGADGTHSTVRTLAGFPAEVYEFDTAQLSWLSPVPSSEPFAIHFLPDGRQVTMVGYPEGAAGGWQIPRPAGGAEEAMAPGFEEFRRRFAALVPAAAEPLAAIDERAWRYRAGHGVRCDTWWMPGVALIGEALHAMNPEAGIGSGLGMGDAQALAVAIQRNPEDPDAACRDWEYWRRPALAPYLAIGSEGVRVVRGGEPGPDESWPPA